MILTIQGSHEGDGWSAGFWGLLIALRSGLWKRTKARRGKKLAFGIEKEAFKGDIEGGKNPGKEDWRGDHLKEDAIDAMERV